MDVASMKKSIASHLHDPAATAVVDAQLLDFINDAARDAAQAGWLLDADRVAISLLGNSETDQFDVPSGFVYILDIFDTSTYSIPEAPRLEKYFWRLELVSGTPKIILDTRITTKKTSITIYGYKKPKEYTADSDTIDVGIESFIRERATAYAARYLARTGSAVARNYEQLFQDAFAVSDQMIQQQLARQQAYFRLHEARRVPGR